MMAFPARFKRGHQVGYLSRRELVLDVAIIGIWLVANGSAFFFFCRSSRLRTPSSLGQPADLETILQAEVFVNEGDLQVRAAHKILGYDPIQKYFVALKYVIMAKDPQLRKITVVEHDFLLPEGSSAQEGVALVGSSSSQQAVETKEGGAEGEEQVIKLSQSEDKFGVFNQFDPSEDPSGDLGDPSLTEADLQVTSSQANMGFKRKPSASLLDLIEGQLGKDAPRKSQPKLPFPRPSPNPQPPQTKSSAAPPQPPKFPPLIQPANPKRKRFAKRERNCGWGEILLFLGGGRGLTGFKAIENHASASGSGEGGCRSA